MKSTHCWVLLAGRSLPKLAMGDYLSTTSPSTASPSEVTLHKNQQKWKSIKE